MPIIIAISLLLAGSFIGPDAAAAQIRLQTDTSVQVSASASSSRNNDNDRRQQLEERKQQMRSSMEERRDQVKTRVAENVRTRVSQFSTRIFAGIDASFERLSVLDTKIDTRIDELTAKGVNVSVSADALADATRARVAAEANVDALQADFTAALNGETSRADLMALVKTAREELRTARQAYADVLLTLRADIRAHSSAN